MENNKPSISTQHTLSRLYFSKSLWLGNMPIESFTGIRYLRIILCQTKTGYRSSYRRTELNMAFFSVFHWWDKQLLEPFIDEQWDEQFMFPLLFARVGRFGFCSLYGGWRPQVKNIPTNKYFRFGLAPKRIFTKQYLQKFDLRNNF